MTRIIAAFHVVSRRALRLFFLVLLLPACSIVRQPTPEEYESVRQKKKAIVLFRLTASIDWKEVQLLIQGLVADSHHTSAIWFDLANLDTSEPREHFSVANRSDLHFSPSAEVAESGWAAFLLEPGTYYLRVTAEPKLIDPTPEFRVIVPPNTSLLYIGSLGFACATKNAGDRAGGRQFDACWSEGRARNEELAAKQIAEMSFRDLGSLSTMIMQHYHRNPLRPGAISRLAPLGLLVPRNKIAVASPKWMKRAIDQGLLPSEFFSGLSMAVPMAGPLAFAWAPVGVVLGYIGGKWSESSWEPCRAALQDSLSKFDPMAALATKLKTALDHEEVQTLVIGMGGDTEDEALTSDFRSILSAQITRVGLRLCSRTLCLDVATHVTLFDMATQTYVYDRVFVYSGAQLELQPYELFVTSSTTPASGRELEAYCAEGGGKLLEADLSNALDAIVSKIVRELGLSGE